MNNLEPNTQQQKLIQNTEGIYLVDAGAGTGKTFTVTRRYANILSEKDIEPEDLLLVTFTENAAEEMKKKVIDLCEGYSPTQMHDAPIRTFHSLCKRVVDSHGFEAPKLLDIDDRITPSTEIMENEVLEEQEFRRFLDSFIEDNPEYDDFYCIIYDSTNLLHLLKTLASKGIFPTEKGWFMKGEDYLEGNFQKFEKIFKKANKPKNDGNRQSDLRSRLYSFNDKCFTEEAPDMSEIRGRRGCKQVPEEFAEKAFNEDRTELKKFVHDLYREYIRYSLGRNYLNFNFLMMFAYVLLHENHELREEISYEYIMIDEFQDTSEIQFKLSLLLAKDNNICAVGDWKQSIYSFQYADVKNIQEFEDRLKKYKQELNSDYPRIEYPIKNIETIPLKNNYRSTQKILDFSEQSLSLKATRREKIDIQKIQKEITSLESKEKTEPTEIKALKSEEEKETILEKIQEIVHNPDYKIKKEENWKTPDYEDIVILVRRSKFGLKLQEKARKHDIPLVYEGGTEIFKTNPAKILLAWLRILDYEDSKRGWSVALERAGYTLDEIKNFLDDQYYPENMLEFLEGLEDSKNVTTVARKVFNEYGIDNAFADKVIEVLQSVFNNSYMNLGRIIQFIEDNIEHGKSYEVDNTPKKNVVKVRTIHAEKGLEHPIVFISDVNQGHFPSTTGRSKAIDYDDPIGLRQKRKYSEQDIPYVYDNWRTELLYKCLTGDYDEERRLMYVAMTRAQRYLFFTAEKGKASKFFQDLDIEPQEIIPEIERGRKEETEPSELVMEKPTVSSPVKLSVHSLIGEIKSEGRSMEFGTKVHMFAENLAKGKKVNAENEDEENVREFIESLDGELFPEQSCFLPLKTEKRKVTLSGTIDLVNKKENRVDIIDYKTDTSRKNEEEYVKQLSAYYHVLNEVFENKKVTANIFYTHNGKKIPIDPIPKKELGKTLEKSFF